jgi:hypothetical protein
MFTLEDIANEKLRAKTQIIEGQFKNKILDEILEMVMYDSTDTYVFFDDFTHETFNAAIVVAESLKDDFRLKNYIEDINIDKENLDIEFKIALDLNKNIA